MPASTSSASGRRRVVEVELTPIHFREALDHAGEVADRDLLDRALARLEPEARAVVGVARRAPTDPANDLLGDGHAAWQCMAPGP